MDGSIDDLNADEAEDENWTDSPNSGIAKSAEAKRVLPKRKSRNSIKKFTCSENESD